MASEKLRKSFIPLRYVTIVHCHYPSTSDMIQRWFSHGICRIIPFSKCFVGKNYPLLKSSKLIIVKIEDFNLHNLLSPGRSLCHVFTGYFFPQMTRIKGIARNVLMWSLLFIASILAYSIEYAVPFLCLGGKKPLKGQLTYQIYCSMVPG